MEEGRGILQGRDLLHINDKVTVSRDRVKRESQNGSVYDRVFGPILIAKVSPGSKSQEYRNSFQRILEFGML